MQMKPWLLLLLSGLMLLATQTELPKITWTHTIETIRQFIMQPDLQNTELANITVNQTKHKYSTMQPDVAVTVDNLQNVKRSIAIVGNDFVLNNKTFRYVSGSLHYFRVPSTYWRDRLQKLRQAGLNAVSTYVEWSFHEPEERKYLWTNDRDLVKFIKIAEEEGLYVLLRPGPYICAERDLGGYPYWLLGKYPNIRLRSVDKDHMNEVRIWFKELFQRITPLLYGNGGPIILVQVENEYGSYSCGGNYTTALYQIMKEHVQDAALFYTADQNEPGMYECGAITNVLTTVAFGSRTKVAATHKELRKFMPQGPLVNSEYYLGWLTHWGEAMARVPQEHVVRTFKEMLEYGWSVNFYVFFGGTNFEYTAGANTPGYMPDITSYDYDAPITEAGDVTPKYFAIRKVLEETNRIVKKLSKPTNSSKAEFGRIKLSPKMRLLSPEAKSLLGVSKPDAQNSRLPSFESLRQRAGFVLYETKIPKKTNGMLYVAKIHDRAYVFVNQLLHGIMYRAVGLNYINITAPANSTLSILVEHMGRINYGLGLHDRKGASGVYLDGVAWEGYWKIIGFPLENIKVPETEPKDIKESNSINDHSSASPNQTRSLLHGPVFYEGTFSVSDDNNGKDTFFNPEGWTKGIAWVNDYNLGRYWPKKGPLMTLYVPGVYLKPAPSINVIRILELESESDDPYISFIKEPKYRV